MYGLIMRLFQKDMFFLIPYSEKEANLSIAYPDYPKNIKLNIDDMWNRMYDIVSRYLNQNFRITDKFEITRYMMGICNKPKMDNTYFVGNCFGTISPGMGFGQFASILTGIYSAYDICGKGRYEKLVKPLLENYNHSLVLRRFLETLNDNELDFIIKNLDNKLINGLINKISNINNRFEVLGALTPFLRLWNKYKNIKNK